VAQSGQDVDGMQRARKERPFRGISEAELAVLEALWESPGPPNELQERLARGGPEWAYTTVQTLLHRLLEKGFVARKRDGVAQIYSAAIDRDELLARHVSDLAARLCGGAVSPLVLSLVKTRRFSKGELARFRALIEDAEKGPRK
jgi:BlaI family transcriptional regulator, penicillinase repressor